MGSGALRLTISSLREGIAAGEIKAVDVCSAALERIERFKNLNAFITVIGDAALAQAEEIDQLAARGEPLPPLAGTIVAVKDNMVMRGVRTTAGSRILFNYKPPYTATAIERLEDAGAIIIGKTNQDEFAMGSSTENSAFGPVKNPVGHRARAGRVIRRIGSRGGRGDCDGGARFGHRRFDSPTRESRASSD